MEKELALRTFAYLIGHYKTHEETIINSQEIEAINYILDENETLETQLKKQKEINQRAIKYIKNNLIVSSILDGKKYYSLRAIKYIKNNLIVSSILDGKKYYSLNDYGFDYKKLLEILEDKEV